MQKKHTPKVTIPLKDCIDLFYKHKLLQLSESKDAVQRQVLLKPYEIHVIRSKGESKIYSSTNSVKDYPHERPAYNQCTIECHEDIMAIKVFQENYLMLDIVFE